MHNDIHSPLSQLILNDCCGLAGLSALHSSNDHPYALAQLGCRWEECKAPESISSPAGFGAWPWAELELELFSSKEEV